MSAQSDRDGDAARALLALYDTALPVVYGYFVRRCRDRGTAEDLTSETFLAALQTVRTAVREGDPPPIAIPWLLGVARHKLADHYRRRSAPEPVADPPADTVDDWDAELDRLVAESVLTRLSDSHRTVLVLRYMDDCTVGECAELIGRTLHATETLLVRAKRAFRKEYPEGGTP